MRKEVGIGNSIRPLLELDNAIMLHDIRGGPVTLNNIAQRRFRRKSWSIHFNYLLG